VPQSSASEIEVAIGKLNCYKSSFVFQIPVELIQSGVERNIVLRSINLLSLCGSKKNSFTSGKSQLLYLFIKGG
jgi:hypothetical protein